MHNVFRGRVGCFSTLRSCALPSADERAMDLFHFRGVAVLPARPEEALQTVALAARHHVDVDVRHALADAVIKGHEGAIRAERLLYYRTQPVRGREEFRGNRWRQFRQRLVMAARNQQAMPGKQRPVIEEGEAGGLCENHRRGYLAGGDLAEGAGRHSS